jgi:peptidoglycan-associated lipoprotein
MSHLVRNVALVLLAGIVAGCAKRPPATTTTPPPPVIEDKPATTAASKPTLPVPLPPTKVEEPKIANPPALAEDEIGNRTLEELSAMLKPVFFKLDSSELDESGQATASANAEIMRKNRTWRITIEGHADERGTSEYNLALGERRALAVKAYLVSLGVGADRLTTLSYGEEFPFDAGHDESAWAKNRRAYFQITAK